MKDAGSAVALMGNPNVGKSTVFNALTGGRQHTGNWSGKTVSLAEGRITGEDITLIDLPGTYSLHARSQEEALAREFLTCGGAQAVILVADAACLQRSLVLVLQVLEVQPHAVLCLNLMDEARKKHIRIDTAALSRELGIPVVPCAARSKKGLNELKNTLRGVLSGTLPPCSEPPIRYPADIRCGLYAEPHKGQTRDELDDILTAAAVLRAEEITMTCVTAPDDPHARDRAIDRVVLSRRFGIPLMLLLLAIVFWLTLSGANTVSSGSKRRSGVCSPRSACRPARSPCSPTACGACSRPSFRSCCRLWRSFSRSSPCSRTPAICRASRFSWIMRSAAPAPAASRA